MWRREVRSATKHGKDNTTHRIESKPSFIPSKKPLLVIRTGFHNATILNPFAAERWGNAAGI